MTLYNRGGILYARVDGKRISTKLKDTSHNRKLLMSYYKNDKFFKKFNISNYVPTLAELCEKVLEEKEDTLKKTSYRAYSSLYYSNILPFFKSRLINEIKPIDIKDFYNTFKSGSSLNTCDTIIREAFEKAIIYEYIETTPLIVKRPRIRSDYEINPFSLDEINLIINNASKEIKNILGVAFYTGMRTGEVIGLKWDDINFNDYSISVNRTITCGYIQTPKTSSSLRVIDMLPQTEKFLKSQRQITGLSEYVFLNNRGKHYHTSGSLANQWKKILDFLNLEYRSIYQTRHSFASNMLSNGEDMMWVSSMLGHKSPKITLDCYSKYLKRNRERKSTFLDNSGTKLAQNG